MGIILFLVNVNASRPCRSRGHADPAPLPPPSKRAGLYIWDQNYAQSSETNEKPIFRFLV